MDERNKLEHALEIDSIDDSKYTPIKAGAFFEGMHIDSFIYYKYEDKYVFLCKNKTLDSTLIAKLHKVASAEQKVYVDSAEYESILMKSSDFVMTNQRSIATFAPPKPTPVKTTPIPKRSETLTPLQNRQITESEYKESIKLINDLFESALDDDKITPIAVSAVADNMREKLKNCDSSILLECINVMRDNKSYLRYHSSNVAYLNGLIGSWMNLPEDDIGALIKIGLTHDFGMLHVPPEITLKPGKLTEDEYKRVKQHPQHSRDILEDGGESDIRVLDGVLRHHERANGTGYPDGVTLKDIPLFSRITAISDTYDAMVARHPYREQQSPFDALESFKGSRFSDLDLKIIDIVLKNMPFELIGKRVILSNRQIGIVVHVSQNDLAHPLVKVGGKIIATNDEVRCVSMSGFLQLF